MHACRDSPLQFAYKPASTQEGGKALMALQNFIATNNGKNGLIVGGGDVGAKNTSVLVGSVQGADVRQCAHATISRQPYILPPCWAMSICRTINHCTSAAAAS
jgi:hypothetical protein